MPAQLSAEQMAGLIVDALIDAGIVARADAADAEAIATTEIQVRLSLGNVIVHTVEDEPQEG